LNEERHVLLEKKTVYQWICPDCKYINEREAIHSYGECDNCGFNARLIVQNKPRDRIKIVVKSALTLEIAAQLAEEHLNDWDEIEDAPTDVSFQAIEGKEDCHIIVMYKDCF
jgi:DNA-directed RNA polymerase subunit RPC12/RpoP